jgi:hypothetical protein
MNRDVFLPSPAVRRLLPPAPGAFLLWPAWTSGVQGGWQELLYHWALVEARAVASPSWLERDLLAVWN